MLWVDRIWGHSQDHILAIEFSAICRSHKMFQTKGFSAIWSAMLYKAWNTFNTVSIHTTCFGIAVSVQLQPSKLESLKADSQKIRKASTVNTAWLYIMFQYRMVFYECKLHSAVMLRTAITKRSSLTLWDSWGSLQRSSSSSNTNKSWTTQERLILG